MVVSVHPRQRLREAVRALAQRVDPPPARRYARPPSHVPSLPPCGSACPALGRQDVRARVQRAAPHPGLPPTSPRPPLRLAALHSEPPRPRPPAGRGPRARGLAARGGRPHATGTQAGGQVTLAAVAPPRGHTTWRAHARALVPERRGHRHRARPPRHGPPPWAHRSARWPPPGGRPRQALAGRRCPPLASFARTEHRVPRVAVPLRGVPGAQPRAGKGPALLGRCPQPWQDGVGGACHHPRGRTDAQPCSQAGHHPHAPRHRQARAGHARALGLQNSAVTRAPGPLAPWTTPARAVGAAGAQSQPAARGAAGMRAAGPRGVEGTRAAGGRGPRRGSPGRWCWGRRRVVCPRGARRAWRETRTRCGGTRACVVDPGGHGGVWHLRAHGVSAGPAIVKYDGWCFKRGYRWKSHFADQSPRSHHLHF
jgi:hypothetical protein